MIGSGYSEIRRKDVVSAFLGLGSEEGAESGKNKYSKYTATNSNKFFE